MRIGSAAALKSDRVVTMTPHEYLGVIESLGVFSSQVEAETEAQAETGIRECQRLLQVIRHAKKAVTLDLESIRAYQKEMEKERGARRFFGLTLARPVSGVVRRRFRQRMLETMRPYESIMHQLDEILDQVNKRHHRLRVLIDE